MKGEILKLDKGPPQIRNPKLQIELPGLRSVLSDRSTPSRVQSEISDFGFESLMSPWLTTKHQNSQQSPGRNFNKLRLFWKEVGFCPISKFSFLALCTVCCLLSACKVGPKYKTPTAPVPPAFKEPLPSNWKTAAPQDGTLRGDWWAMFNDPQLNDLEAQVDISNQTVAVAEAQFRGARAAVRAARSGLFPTLTVNAGATRSGSGTRGGAAILGGGNTVHAGGGTFYSLPFDFSYEFDVWGRVRRTVEAAAATAQASAADVETVRLSNHAELAMDYFGLRGLDEEKKLFDETVKGYEEALELAKNRFNQGVASGVDVEKAQPHLTSARAQATDLDLQRSQFEHAIAILIGKPPAALTLERGAIIGEPPVIPLTLPSELLERRADVAAAERQVASANAQIGVAKAAYFPAVSLSAVGGFQNSAISSLLSWPSRFWSIGPAFSEILFDAGKRRAMVAQAEAAYDATVGTYRQSVL